MAKKRPERTALPRFADQVAPLVAAPKQQNTTDVAVTDPLRIVRFALDGERDRIVQKVHTLLNDMRSARASLERYLAEDPPNFNMIAYQVRIYDGALAASVDSFLAHENLVKGLETAREQHPQFSGSPSPCPECVEYGECSIHRKSKS